MWKSSTSNIAQIGHLNVESNVKINSNDVRDQIVNLQDDHAVLAQTVWSRTDVVSTLGGPLFLRHERLITTLDQNPSPEANSYSASQKIPLIL
jgi:hypothetical protein